MLVDMKAIIKMVYMNEKEFFIIIMVIDMLGIIKTINLKEKEYIIIGNWKNNKYKYLYFLKNVK